MLAGSGRVKLDDEIVAIERLLNDRHLARTLGARAACKAAAEYEVSAMVRRYNSMYDVLLSC